MYMPPKAWLTHKYLGKLLSGEKKLLRMDQLRTNWTPPTTPFLTLVDILNDLQEKVPELMDYLPDLRIGQSPPKDYFFRVVNTLVPDFSTQYLEMIEHHREEHQPEDKTLMITNEAYQLLEQAHIPKLGKKRNFGGYIINVRERRERQRKPQINPDFQVGHQRD